MKQVYFLRPVGQSGPIKIGCSATPAKRLRTIEIWSPLLLELVASAPGEHRHEWALHQQFAKQRLHGEWFSISPELSALINHVAENGVLPPIEIADDLMKWREARASGKGSRARRDPAAQVAKARLTTRVHKAEKHAFGYGTDDSRPDEVARIIASYQGLGSGMPSEADLALLESYIATLKARPRADRSFAAWSAWFESRKAGKAAA